MDTLEPLTRAVEALTRVVQAATEPNWVTIVTAGGALATAVGTIGLAVATYLLVRATKAISADNAALIVAANHQAEASAQTVAEILRDRELAQEPYLIRGARHGAVVNARGTIWTQNTGGGTAINCRVVYKNGSRLIETAELFSVAPGGEADHLLSASGIKEVDSDRWALLEGLEGYANIMVCLCEDTLGRRYRFRWISEDTDMTVRDGPFRPEGAGVPEWATWRWY